MPRPRQLPWCACALAVTQAACTNPSGKGSDSRAAPEPEWPVGALVLDGVAVLDAAGAREDRALVLVGDEIWAEQAAGGPWPEDAEVLDRTGRWVVPALIDAHVHLSLGGTLGTVPPTLAANLEAHLAWGVLGVADLGGPEVLFDLRDHISAGELAGPRIFATGPFLTVAGSHPCEVHNDRDQCRFVDDDGTAAELVAALERADGLKVALADAAFTPWPTPRLDLGDLAEITAAARVPVFAHTDTPEDVADALDNGVAVLAHPVFSAPGAPPPNAPVTSTLGAFTATAALLDGDLLSDDLRHTPEAVREDWAAVAAAPELLGADWIRESEAWAEAGRANLESWHEQGVPIVAGSDAGYLFVPHGLGLHRELAALEALGMDPVDALVAATSAPAELLGWTDMGWVAPGMRADLLVLGSDPRETVAALRDIEDVYQGGRPVERPAPTGAGSEGTACLDTADCDTGLLCDPARWRCAPVCAEAGAVLDDCGAAACVAVDGADPVCRTLPACSLVDQDCSPEWYGENCVPVDINTNTCWPGGSATEGERCDWAGGVGGCAPGLYCSVIDATCYRYCEPGGDDCAPDQECQVQRYGGEDWFALCL